ncbi:MAG: hypothetical protein ABI623_05225, partial [bacterium]
MECVPNKSPTSTNQHGIKRKKLNNNRQIKHILKITGLVVLIVVGSGVVVVSAFLLFPDYFVNHFAKDKIEKMLAAEYPAYTLNLGNIHYNVWQNKVVFTSLSLSSKDSSFSSTAASAAISDVKWLKILNSSDTAYYSYLARTKINGDDIVLRFPQWHYELRCNNLKISVSDSTIIADRVEYHPLWDGVNDSSFSCAIASANLSNVNCLRLLQGIDTTRVSPFIRANGVANDLVFNFPKTHYELTGTRLKISVPDSALSLDSVDLRPLVSDPEFFGSSKFRRTRFRFTTPQITINGYQILAMMEGKQYAAREVEIHKPTLDILINKEKPSEKDVSPPRMPNEFAASIKVPIKFDNVNITNAQVLYGEQFTANGKPAVIRLDDVGIAMKGISNRGTITIRAEGLFMKEGKMNIQMTLPLAGPDFALQYSGSVRSMNAESLNPFLVIAEKMRIKSGYLQEGSFDIRIAHGRAQGKVHAIYKDLTVAKLDKETLSENGILDRITSFLANFL